jgi:arginyl-tRNA synthetase
MSNSIGESLSRIMDRAGAQVSRANYQGDVGLHVAKAIWGILKIESEKPDIKSPIAEQVAFISKAYVLGSDKYETEENSKKEIDQLNKIIFDRSDAKINAVYDWGRKVTLDHFEEIYAKLGTKFDHYFFESEMAPIGEKIVRDNIKDGIFEKSDGAIIFRGEDHKLHNRVFINQIGLPTYEAKELGLNKTKFDKVNPDISVIITGGEQNDYFKVLLKAISLIYPEIASKTKHIGHGMLRFASGKMSSRKGNVITGESLIKTMEDLVREKISDREIDPEKKEKIVTDIAVGAIKYSILRQTAGSDIIYDFNKSISFEGDSGPYLQYSSVRANSILRKATEEGVEALEKIEQINTSRELNNFEKLLFRLDEVVERSLQSMEPHHIVNYLIELSSAFNSYYANNQIIDKNNPESAYRITLVKAFRNVMVSGLSLLAINVPEKM